jgi:hypothetical protein
MRQILRLDLAQRSQRLFSTLAELDVSRDSHQQFAL